jgi:hypothetical protein
MLAVLAAVALSPVVAAAEPPASAVSLRLDGGGRVAVGAEITYRVTVTNHGRHDVDDGKVVLSLDDSFTASVAGGSHFTRPNVVVWQAALPAGRDTVFTVAGHYGQAPGPARVARATGCAFAPKVVQPLVCNTEVDQLVAPAGSSGRGWLLLGLGIAVPAGVLLGLVVLALRLRARRKAFGGNAAPDRGDIDVTESV